jgi:hypothetical protein
VTSGLVQDEQLDDELVTDAIAYFLRGTRGEE